MPARRNDKVEEVGTAQSIVSTAVGAAETLSLGVLHLTERTLIEALRAVEDIGSELRSAVVRAARGSIKAAEDIGGDLVEVGKGVSRGVAEPARQLGDGAVRLADGLWTSATRTLGTTPSRGRKPPAKAAARRSRRRPAA
jgi:hypothetical protein